MPTPQLRPDRAVRVWLNVHPFPNYLDPMRRLAADFTAAHPECPVEVEGHDFRTLPGRVAASVAAGRPPDLVEYYCTGTQLARDTLAATGRPLFVPVERAIAGRSEILGEPVLVDDLFPAVRDYYSYRGELSSMPASATTVLMYSNTTVLRAAGVRQIPKTWDEVEAACARLAGHRAGPAHGIVWPNAGWFFQQAVAEQGGLLTDGDNGRSDRARRVDLASPQLLAYVRWWQRLHRAGHYCYSGQEGDWPGVFDAFANQQAAFMLGTSKMADVFVQIGIDAGFEVLASPPPRNRRVAYAGNHVAGQAFWLVDGLDEPVRDAALAFTQFLLQPPNAAYWHRESGFMPVTRAAYDLLAAEGWFEQNPHLRVAPDHLRTAAGTPAALGALVGDFAGIQDELTAAMHDVLTAGADPADRFAAATAAAQRLLDGYNADCLGSTPRTPSRLLVG